MDRFSNINTILAFVTVAREGSVSRAAEVLNLTQPAISHQLKRLGEETGITLFNRTPTGLQISNDGAAILPKAERVLDAVSDFQRSARKRSGHISGKLKIGTIVDPEFIRLGRILARMRSEHPGIQTELTHGVSGDVLTWLKRGQIDAGFYLCGPDDLTPMGLDSEDPVHAIKLADFSYRVIGPAGWQKRIETAAWPELAKLPWIGTPERSVHYRLLSKVYTNPVDRLGVVARVDQEASMLEMVRSGIGLSLCRESIALHQKQSFGLAVCNSVSVPACLCFITLERQKDNPAITETFKLLQSVW
ncbi:LysR family transcriptional regulator [Sulfitobacter geojensis]|uniref:LysR family transcriptional regulator n=1 Tax=Sulfitobacter geojensis TaxID=1342299 RepID=UPI0004694B9A|nr:LysR family transcriptional regulator [Sulfitobacter geojensis]KHA54208.1 Transcriptional regulator, LysR family [Sulfitobacter geojensis]NYI30034.1 DNA-binding transcriptional LysR family regulator [Sulfitobacter geojensis]